MRLALCIAVVACSSSHAHPVDAVPPDIYIPVDVNLAADGLAFSTPSLPLAWPDTEKVAVTAHYTDDATMDVTAYATYTTDAPDIATMYGGTAYTYGPGTATITASYMGQTATMTVVVSVRTLAVATPDGVDFLVASAQGAAAPTHSIRGASTTLQHACGLAVLGSDVFVVDSVANAIDVWDVSASGDVAPARQIALAFTPASVAAAGTSLYVGAVDGVRVFDASATGTATPTATIAGAQTTITSGAGVAIYQSELYVVNASGSVAVFAIAATGNVAPSRVVAGANTGLASAAGIAIGFGLEFVTDALAQGSVQVFLPASSGNAVPAQAITGSPELDVPTSLAIADTMLFVGTPGSSSIELFPTSTDGQFPATQVITGEDVQALAIF